MQYRQTNEEIICLSWMLMSFKSVPSCLTWPLSWPLNDFLQRSQPIYRHKNVIRFIDKVPYFSFYILMKVTLKGRLMGVATDAHLGIGFQTFLWMAVKAVQTKSFFLPALPYLMIMSTYLRETVVIIKIISFFLYLLLEFYFHWRRIPFTMLDQLCKI